jgi:1-acyl-sn-glycerol-3-phosphate acyltransferase
MWASLSGALRLLGFIGLLIVLPLAHFFVRPFDRSNWPELVRFYYRGLVHILGFTVVVKGTPCDIQPTLFVSNHASYLDVPVLASIVKASFVAKSDVAQWPVIGPLARMQGTVFVERRSIKAAGQRDELRGKLEEGQSLIVFPEGTSTDGSTLLPFKSSLLSIAEKALSDGRCVAVQPVSVVCKGLNGQPHPVGKAPFYAWFGDMTFSPHLWQAFKWGRFTVEVEFYPPQIVKDTADRKALAAYCFEKIRAGSFPDMALSCA